MMHFVTPIAVTAFVLGFTAPAPSQTHQHGDMVGSVTDTSAIVWTRASTIARVSVLYSTDPALVGAMETPQVITGAAQDYTVKIPLIGLTPHTRYYYATRFRDLNLNVTDGGTVGSFRTAPSPGATPAVRFMLGGDIADGRPFDMFTPMSTHAPDFYLSLGDMPYADGAVTVADFWLKHKQVRDDPLLRRFFRTTSTVATWDDHEVTNNWDGSTDPVRVANGIQAWKLYFPIPANTGEIYHGYVWGDSLEVFVLDTRSHRDANSAPDTPTKTMLGAAQLAWLQQSLSASTALFKIIATSVPLRFGTTGSDHWEGFVHERTALLDYIDDQRISNVLFVSADQHWGASYIQPEGFKEFQVGPVATSIRTPPPLEPGILWIGAERNYGLITIDPAAMPPTLTMEWYGSGGLLRREVVAASDPAKVRVLTDAADSRIRLTGQTLSLEGGGNDFTLSQVPGGRYGMMFRGIDHADGTPATLPLTVPSGSTVCIAGDYRDADPLGHAVLAEHDFSGPLTGFTVVDEGTTSAPSSWFTSQGQCYQTSNIYSNASGVMYPGSHAITGDPAWTDYSTRVRLQSLDNDGIGVIVRYTDNNNYYRFSMDSQRAYRRLVSKKNGVFTALAEDATAYQQGRVYDVEVIAVGNRIRVLLDGTQLFSVTDNDHTAGAVGLYVWGNQPSLFDYLIVRAGDNSTLPPTPGTLRPTLASVVDGQRLGLFGIAPGNQGLRYVLALSGGRTPGIPLRIVQAGDPRTIELEPDGLFWASLQPSALFAGFLGTVDPLGEIRGRVDWPPIPILSGLRLYAGGWIWNPDGTVGPLLPTVETRYP